MQGQRSIDRRARHKSTGKKYCPNAFEKFTIKLQNNEPQNIITSEPCPGEKGNKEIKVMDSNKRFFLTAFHFWELLHLAAGLGHNRKHCRICKALDLRWASKQEQPFESGKAGAKKIIWPQACHLLRQNKDTAPFGFYIYVAFRNPLPHFHLLVLHSSQAVLESTRHIFRSNRR